MARKKDSSGRQWPEETIMILACMAYYSFLRANMSGMRVSSWRLSQTAMIWYFIQASQDCQTLPGLYGQPSGRTASDANDEQVPRALPQHRERRSGTLSCKWDSWEPRN